ncbi:MAG: hypothetical protein J0L72_08325 [Armatimonadetes bacterium]|nr:hypothetical protein [Armatimonadota bacterium]
MNTPQFHRRRQKAVVFVGFLLFAMILFLIQLWLFVMILEKILAGRTEMVLPAAIVSIVLCAVNVWMLIGTKRLMNYR